ncbi:MAG: prohibitin family protein, partial [Christensenellales bacterium]
FILPAVAILVVLAFTFCTARVPTGYTGIVTTFGKVEDGTLEAGFHIKSPVQKVIMMDNREQRETFSTQAFSSDIQQVQIVGSINYNINKQTAMTLYKEVGTAYSSTLITPRLFEHTKSVFSLYSAEDLVANRSNLSTSIRAALANELSAYGINVVSISIEDIDFSDAFTDAVEAKQVAEQTKLKVETEQAQQISIEKADAERRRISAEAEASAARTKADAEAYALTVQAAAEAEANELIAGSLTTDLLEYWKIERWTGEVPQVQLGTDAYPIIDITPSMGD